MYQDPPANGGDLGVMAGACPWTVSVLGSPGQCCDGRRRPAVDPSLLPPCRRNRYIRVDFVQETPGGYISVAEAKSLKGAVTEHRVVVSSSFVILA